MVCYPNAKINIGLNVVEKRSDGYHNLETIFFPTPLTDILELVRNEDSIAPYTWSSSGIEIDAHPDDNICIKALMLVKEKYDIPPINIHLHKMIPFGAGLGGGSADGAFMIMLLNKEFALNMSHNEMHTMATKLGADCPFFLQNKPSFAAGIGDELEDIKLDLSGYHFALVKPTINVSTPEAYKGVKPQKSKHSLKELIQLPIDQWKHHIKNDFEKSVFKLYPEIGNIKMQMYDAGASYACMSGSGSSVFGIFKEDPSLSFDKDYFIYQHKL